MMLLPAAIVGFAIATEEFRNAQTQPDLDLYWQVGDGMTAKEISLQIPSAGSASPPIRMTLQNKGNEFSNWYMLDLQFPGELFVESRAPSYTWPLRPIVGKKDENWKTSLRSDNGEFIFTFMSNGQLAVYPGYDLYLADVLVILNATQEYSSQYQVHYNIVSHRGRRRAGILTIHLVQEKDS